MATASPPAFKMTEHDRPLRTIGFEIGVVSADLVTGRLKVTESCCQPFGMLHGGISALVAEALASTGAFVASGFRPVSGIQLSINHHRSSSAGGHVFARAAPVQVGKTIQVWEVCLYKMDPISSEKGDLISSARVTLLVNLPVPANAQNAGDALKKYARL